MAPGDSPTIEKAIFGAGCFWGVEEAFRRLPGVLQTRVGFAGGTIEAPSYEQVCGGLTGHAEVVEVHFDPGRVSFSELLRFFWSHHDPTLENVGQYRSIVVCRNQAQIAAARLLKTELETAGSVSTPFATEVLLGMPFHEAEEYHQQYYAKRERAARELKLRCRIE